VTPIECSINGCDRLTKGRGWCSTHYERWRVHGDPQIIKIQRGMPLEDRVRECTDATGDGCWLWTGVVSSDGYARLNVDDRLLYAHRLVYEIAVGPIPEGYQVDHTCHVHDECTATATDCLHRRCVRPDHLAAVTPRVNILRSNNPAAKHARKTHCKRGHPFEGENLVIRKSGYRQCRTCRREDDRRRDALKRGMAA
jgi:hypothetical protein